MSTSVGDCLRVLANFLVLCRWLVLSVGSHVGQLSVGELSYIPFHRSRGFTTEVSTLSI